jgi:hypothetical protein
LHSGVWATAVWDSAQIATSTAKNLISTPFVANGTGHEMLRSIERDRQKWKPVLRDKRPRLSRDRALIFLKERMIFSPNRSLFGGSCVTEPRLFSHIKVFARFVEQNAHNRASCPSVNSEHGQSEGASVVGSVIVKQGVAPGGFIPRSRDAHKVGP